MKKFGWVMLVSTLLICQLSYAKKSIPIPDKYCGEYGTSGACTKEMPVCMLHSDTNHSTGVTTQTQYCCKTKNFNDACVSAQF